MSFRRLAIGSGLWETVGVAKLTKVQKAKRRTIKTARKTAKKQRRDLRERTKADFGDGLDRLEQTRYANSVVGQSEFPQAAI